MALSLKGEKRALTDGDHRTGLIQRQVRAVYLVLFLPVFARVFF